MRIERRTKDARARWLSMSAHHEAMLEGVGVTGVSAWCQWVPNPTLCLEVLGL